MDWISVREASAVTILEKVTDKKVEYVLDPTLLADGSVWDELCTGKTSGKDYILIYELSNDPCVLKIAAAISKRLDMEVWYINDYSL